MAKTATIINYTLGQTDELTCKEFIDTKLKLFSAHSNVRGIPFLGDGFKQSHRKAIWGMLCRGEGADKDTIERLAARACSDTDYHHGAASMEGTLVTLAQKFIGSNNMPLVEGFGQFGNRLSRKSASARYIKAKISPNFRKVFRKEDDLILQHHYSNGDKIEPLYFIPILPVCLLNGADGIGTGHSTYILGYNPNDLKSAIQQVLKGKKLKPGTLKPWYDGYKGTIERDPVTNQVEIRGVYQEEGNLTIRVTELPVGVQDEHYEAHLHKLMDKEIIKNFVNQSDEEGFDYLITAPRSTTSKDPEELMKLLKLVSKETENLTLWDTNGALRRFDNVEQIIEEFVEWRIARYEDRRQALIKLTEEDILWLDERIRFINFYLVNTEKFRNTGKKDLLELLSIQEDFTRPEALLNLSIWYLTKDKIEELEKELEAKLAYLEQLQGDTPVAMYAKEISELKL
jgi:DNA topoisomerase-2